MNEQESLALEAELDVSGTRGYSAYEIAQQNGFSGTEEEWLASLVGPQGAQGPQGEPGTPATVPTMRAGTIETLDEDEDAYVNIIGTPETFIMNMGIPRGLTGNGIQSIVKTSTSDLVDTYTVTYTDGNTSTIEVTNGKGITHISKTATVGNVDTYTIYYNDNTASTYTVTNSTVSNDDFNDLTDTVNKYKTISKVLPKIEEEGVDFSLDNTVDDVFMEVIPEGNSTQNETTDNLFDNTWESGGINSTDGTNNWDNLIRTKNYIPVFPNHLYSISRTIYNGYMYFRFYDKDYNYLGYQSLSQGLVTSNQSDNRMSTGVSNMTFTIVNENVRYMRCVDNTNDLSIVYTLTTQAINPDYPSYFNHVSGNQNILIRNKNLLNLDEAELGAIDESGVNAANINNFRSIGYIKVKPNTKYYYTRTDYGNSVITLRLYEYDGTKTFISPRKISNSKSLSVTTSANTQYIRWTVYTANVTITEAIAKSLNLQIEESQSATSYEEYKEQNYRLTLSSKNLLDFNNITVARLGNQGTVTVDGNDIIFEASGQSVYGIDIDLHDLNLKTNTSYTISNLYENTGSFGATNGWRYYDGSTYTVLAGDKTYFNFTTGNGTTNKLYFYIGTPGTFTGKLRLYNIQLLEGLISQADIPQYAPYIGTPLKLAGAGDYRDFIFKNEKDSPYYDETLVLHGWYKKKRAKVLNDFTSATFNSVEQGITVRFSDSLIDGNNKMPILSTHQIDKDVVPTSDEWRAYDGTIIRNLYPQANLHAFYINKQVDNGTQARQWFTGLNPTVIYPITPINELITNGFLTDQFDDLYNKARSYDIKTRVTNSVDDGSNLVLVAKCSALADLNTILDNINNAILEIGGE